jgi:hypothetical protein
VVFAAVAAITGGCTEGTPEPSAVVVRSTECTYPTVDLNGYLWHSVDPLPTADGDVSGTMVFSSSEKAVFQYGGGKSARFDRVPKNVFVGGCRIDTTPAG